MVKAMKISSRRSTILIIVIGIILVLSLNFFQKEVKGFFYTISSPLQKTFWGAGDNVSDFFESITNFKNLKTENNELQLAIQELLAENASLKELKNENEALREALQIGLSKDFQLALVEVTAKDIGQESILINQGTKDGLLVGMPVVTPEKILLGKLTEVYENFSRVTLISNKESSFDAKVPGTNTTGVAKGKGDSKIELDLVPQDKTLKVGDLVVSSALGAIYPEGLLAGVVEKVDRNDVSPFYQVEVSPLFDISKIATVFVILNFIND